MYEEEGYMTMSQDGVDVQVCVAVLDVPKTQDPAMYTTYVFETNVVLYTPTDGYGAGS